MSEHDEQVTLFSWAKRLEGRHPQLKWMFAVPNGGKRKNGWWEKAEGLKKGVHDIFLPIPTNCYEGPIAAIQHGEITRHHGLFIEMKFGKNKLTKDQQEFKIAMDAEGYKTVTCWTFEEAKQAIIDYLGIETK
jgi:hypothetical protein